LPDPDRYKLQANETVETLFAGNFSLLSKTLKNYDIFYTDEKYKLGNAVTKSIKNLRFLTRI
jgi:hypothetical protein